MKQHRFFDRARSTWVLRLLPGEFATSKKALDKLSSLPPSQGLMTVLGSCVAVCLMDKSAGVMGMNHFMLPEQLDPAYLEHYETNPANRSARYGSYAMELLINALLAQGAKREHLGAWIFGGGQILAGMTDIGQSNVQFATQYLLREKIKIKGQDTGGKLARKLYFAPELSAPECRLIQESLNRVQHREIRHAASLASGNATQKTDISLFQGA
jgi:chemotaxis protein CheD